MSNSCKQTLKSQRDLCEAGLSCPNGILLSYWCLSSCAARPPDSRPPATWPSLQRTFSLGGMEDRSQKGRTWISLRSQSSLLLPLIYFLFLLDCPLASLFSLRDRLTPLPTEVQNPWCPCHHPLWCHHGPHSIKARFSLRTHSPPHAPNQPETAQERRHLLSPLAHKALCYFQLDPGFHPVFSSWSQVSSFFPHPAHHISTILTNLLLAPSVW